MATKDECIKELQKLGVDFDPDAHVATLNKLLKGLKPVEQEPVIELISEEARDDYEIKAKDVLKVGLTGDLKARVEGIIPCGSDKAHPYTRYKMNIDGDKHLMSERLVRKLFIKEIK